MSDPEIKYEFSIHAGKPETGICVPVSIPFFFIIPDLRSFIPILKIVTVISLQKSLNLSVRAAFTARICSAAITFLLSGNETVIVVPYCLIHIMYGEFPWISHQFFFSKLRPAFGPIVHFTCIPSQFLRRDPYKSVYDSSAIILSLYGRV